MRRLLLLTCLFVLATGLPAHADTPTLTVAPTPTVATSGDPISVEGSIPNDASGTEFEVALHRSIDAGAYSEIAPSVVVNSTTKSFSFEDTVPDVSSPTTVTYQVSWAGDLAAGGVYDPGSATSDTAPLTVLPKSTLSVEPLVSSAVVGEDVTVKGTLSVPPGRAGESILVKRSSDGVSFAPVTTSPATTDANGEFSLTDTVDAPGEYTYQASWAGDGATAGSGSAMSTTTLTVKYSSSLTLTRSASSIVFGQQVTLKGAWSSVSGAPGTTVLTIERQKVGGGLKSFPDALGLANKYQYVDTPPSAGTFTYATSWPGDAEHFGATSATVSVTVTKRPTTLSLDVTHQRVTIGDATTLVATLGHAGTGASIRFQKKAGTTWQTIDTVPVGADRIATLKVAPSEKKTYRAVFDATTSLKGSASDPVTVEVRPIMIGHMTGTFSRVGRYAVYHCCTAYFYARLKPIHPKEAWIATVQYYGNGRWHRLGAGTYRFELDGDAAIFLNASSGYRYRVRGRFDGDADHLSATSPWSYFRFVK
jgi:hypothetical protein